MDETVLRRRLLTDNAVADGYFDVMTIGNYEVPIWAKNGWISRLDTLPDDYELDDIIPSLRTSLSYEGHLYALPFYAESIMTYYRKDLFKQAGLSMPANPTFDQIERFARKIHNPSQQVYGICLRGKAGWGENMALITSLVHAFGGRWFNPAWIPQLNSEQWRETLSYYKNILTKYGPPNVARNGYYENLELFAEGHCGMWIDATVAAGYLYNPTYSQVAEKVAFTSAPREKAVASLLWSWTFAIPASSKKKSAAKKFITWATSQQYIRNVGEHVNWISVPPGTRTSTYQSENYRKVAPFSKYVLGAIENATAKNAIVVPVPYKGIQFVDIPEFIAIGTQTGQFISKMLDGTLSLEEVIKYSQDNAYRQMESFGYIKQ
jgi:sorbitol/mannitol transport system substrate-binding protein